MPRRNNHPSFPSCDIISSYFTDMMSLLRNRTRDFQKVFINAEAFLGGFFFFPLVWPEHLELGNFRVRNIQELEQTEFQPTGLLGVKEDR